ncbi:hypothetical protein GCM10010417_12870 [Streptomyces carpaticus]
MCHTGHWTLQGRILGVALTTCRGLARKWPKQGLTHADGYNHGRRTSASDKMEQAPTRSVPHLFWRPVCCANQPDGELGSRSTRLLLTAETRAGSFSNPASLCIRKGQ